MEWIESIKKSINYLEENLLEKDNVENVAKEVGISSFYLQKGFKVTTEISMSEYVKNRRLYLAGLDVIADKTKIIDIAFKYGYNTPESFTKAFTRFHGVTPSGLRKNPSSIKIYLPLKIVVSVQGGNNMDFTVEKMNSFKVIGFEREFSSETGYEKAPKFWDEIISKYFSRLCNGKRPENEIDETICNCRVGEYGVCIDEDVPEGKFRYLIAGIYTEGEVPQGMTVYEIPELEWVKFRCVGPTPVAIQSVNTKIFKEWLPGNPDYEIAKGINIEWYGMGDNQSPDYEAAIWIPVKRKRA